MAEPKWSDEEKEIWDKIVNYPPSKWVDTSSYIRNGVAKTYQIASASGSVVLLTRSDWTEIYITGTQNQVTADKTSYVITIDGKDIGDLIGLTDGFVNVLFNEVASIVGSWRRTDAGHLQAQEAEARALEAQRIKSEQEAEKKKKDTLDKL